MSYNTFGQMFRITTWGESHGPAIGCVVDGCPPNIPLTEADIQVYLDKRKPGQSRFTTQRKEPDEVRILSGVFASEGGTQVTTGTPISLEIANIDQRPRTTERSRTSSGPVTRTTPISLSMACGTGAVLAGPARVRPRCALPQERLRARSRRRFGCAARWSRSGRTE